MLSRKSGTISRVMVLIFIPLVLMSFTCFSQKATTKTYKADEYGFVQFGNHSFDFTSPGPDTIEVEDVDGTMIKKIVKMDPCVWRMDGKDICSGGDHIFANGKSPAGYLFKKLKKDISLLEDGFYNFNLNNVIVDESGKICAFNYYPILSYRGGLAKNDSEKKKPLIIEKKTEQKFFNAICTQFVNFPKIQPCVADNGEKLASKADLVPPSTFYQLKVEKHKVFFYVKERWVKL